MLYVCVGDLIDGVFLVAVFNAAFCMTSSLLMLVKEVKSDHREEAYSRVGLMIAL